MCVVDKLRTFKKNTSKESADDSRKISKIIFSYFELLEDEKEDMRKDILFDNGESYTPSVRR